MVLASSRKVRRAIGDNRSRRLIAAVLRACYWIGGVNSTGLVVTAASRVPSVLKEGVVVPARRQGVRFELALDDNAQASLFFTGWYERAFIEWLRNTVRPDDVYLDIGAHIGIGALTVGRHMSKGGGRGLVIAVEPTPDSAATLRAGTVRNKLTNIIVEETALGAAPGEITLFADERYGDRDAGVRSRFNTGPAVASVPVTTADRVLDVINPPRLDVVKIDVEGSELDVISGMRATLTNRRPRFIVVEIGRYRLSQAGVTEADIDAEVRRSGYQRTGDVFLENVVYAPVSGTRQPEPS